MAIAAFGERNYTRSRNRKWITGLELTIINPDADRLARELAAITGEELADAVLNALHERLTREQERRRTPRLRDQLRAIRQRCVQLPVLDTRSPGEIVGYDARGVLR